ncbi:MAG: hypothetical protein KatS3mg010_0502 [Acidimicrobiia bacterium]|nr:MAG: hypothetical protein KatS3mg010_0502 [Acidimicrobiia bacterium]
MEHTARTQARRPGRWALAAGVSLIALGLLSFNAFAFFTATATATHDTDTGDMELTLGAAGANHRIGTASTNIVPGDTIQRTIQLNVANQASTMSGVTLDTTGSTSAAFITNTTDGLKLRIARCSVAWTEAGERARVHVHVRRHGAGRPRHERLARRVLRRGPHAEQPGRQRRRHQLPDGRGLVARRRRHRAGRDGGVDGHAVVRLRGHAAGGHGQVAAA